VRAARSSPARYAFHKRPTRKNVPARSVWRRFGPADRTGGDSQARTAGGVRRISRIASPHLAHRV
jgi:hypothetical protein